MKGDYKEGCKGGGRRYDKQGSAYAIRINREAIHRRDRGRAGKGEGMEEGGRKEGGGKGKLYKNSMCVNTLS